MPVNVPDPLLVKLTVPVGVVGLADVSVTVTVHAVGTLGLTELGAQLTFVVVGSTPVTDRLDVLELIA